MQLNGTAGYNKAYARTGEYFGGEGGNTNTTYRPADTNKSHFAYNLDGKSDKYVTAYNNSTNIYFTNFNVGDVSHIGDGIHEVWVEYRSAWFGDYCDFVVKYSPLCWRGGFYLYGDYDFGGVFCSASSNGGGGSGSIRVVLIPL